LHHLRLCWLRDEGKGKAEEHKKVFAREKRCNFSNPSLREKLLLLTEGEFFQQLHKPDSDGAWSWENMQS
jgi:hypothetical protein